MNKLEELKNFVADLFSTATDKTTIEKSAIVSQKIDEIATEQNKLSESYTSLLKDYKDVVLHSSFKPTEQTMSVDSGVPGVSTFNGEELISNFINTHNADGSAK